MEEPSGRKITKIAREAEKLVVQTMKETGIGSGELDLIHLVRHHPGISPKEISTQLNMDKAAVARRTASLEKKGYLIRKPNPDDARAHLLYATDKAENLKLSKKQVEADFYSYLFADEELSEADKTVFLNVLNQLYWRSKKESRSGFPHVRETLKEEESHEE